MPLYLLSRQILTSAAMNLALTEEQQRMRETFARFLDEESSMARVRAALPVGFDRGLWRGLAELGAFSIRVPEASGGLGLGVLDATVLLEEVGRTLASGPIAETLVTLLPNHRSASAVMPAAWETSSPWSETS